VAISAKKFSFADRLLIRRRFSQTADFLGGPDFSISRFSKFADFYDSSINRFPDYPITRFIRFPVFLTPDFSASPILQIPRFSDFPICQFAQFPIFQFPILPIPLILPIGKFDETDPKMPICRFEIANLACSCQNMFKFYHADLVLVRF
jgi:hypothetical protein